MAHDPLARAGLGSVARHSPSPRPCKRRRRRAPRQGAGGRGLLEWAISHDGTEARVGRPNGTPSGISPAFARACAYMCKTRIRFWTEKARRDAPRVHKKRAPPGPAPRSLSPKKKEPFTGTPRTTQHTHTHTHAGRARTYRSCWLMCGHTRAGGGGMDDGRGEQESFLNPSSTHQAPTRTHPAHSQPATRAQHAHWTVILPCMPAPWWGSQ